MLIEQKPNMLYMYRFTEVNFRRNKIRCITKMTSYFKYPTTKSQDQPSLHECYSIPHHRSAM